MSIGDVTTMKKSVPAEKARQGEYRDTRSPIRLGIWILLVGFGGFLLWAAFAPLDEGVPSQGVVSIATKRKGVQNQHGGRIEQVFVREGQMVQEGEVLMKLDTGTAKARYDEVHHTILVCVLLRIAFLQRCGVRVLLLFTRIS